MPSTLAVVAQLKVKMRLSERITPCFYHYSVNDMKMGEKKIGWQFTVIYRKKPIMICLTRKK